MAAPDETNAQPDARQADLNASGETPSVASGGNSGNSPIDRESAGAESSVNMEFLLDIPLEVTVELGRTKMLINDMLKLGQGSVIELSKIAGESLEILANRKPIARGEVVVVNEKYGVRLTEVISPMERVEGLR